VDYAERRPCSRSRASGFSCSRAGARPRLSRASAFAGLLLASGIDASKRCGLVARGRAFAAVSRTRRTPTVRDRGCCGAFVRFPSLTCQGRLTVTRRSRPVSPDQPRGRALAWLYWVRSRCEAEWEAACSFAQPPRTLSAIRVARRPRWAECETCLGVGSVQGRDRGDRRATTGQRCRTLRSGTPAPVRACNTQTTPDSRLGIARRRLAQSLPRSRSEAVISRRQRASAGVGCSSRALLSAACRCAGRSAASQAGRSRRGIRDRGG
jgi:hypothetical protein